MSGDPILQVTDLSVEFHERSLWSRSATSVPAVQNVSFELESAQTLGVLGESGSGKSTLAAALMGLVPSQGTIQVGGRSMDRRTLRARRACALDMQLVFQDPNSSFNARMPVWQVVTEPLVIQGTLREAAQCRHTAAEMMERVGLPRNCLERLPHEFSGGQRQRIAIARALSTRPRILILDEPTSALDVSVQAQVLSLLLDLQRELGLSYLFISHNVSVVRHMSDRILILYRGESIECGPAARVLSNPVHPYARALIAAAARFGAGPN